MEYNNNLEYLANLNPKFKVNENLKGKYVGTFRNVGIHMSLCLETQEIHYILQPYLDAENKELAESFITLPENVLERIEK